MRPATAILARHSHVPICGISLWQKSYWLARFSIHNLHALIQLVKDIRVSIIDGTFESKVPDWLAHWEGNAERMIMAWNRRFHRKGFDQRIMNILHAFLLGILQGLTEFIPVSSTAHLLIGQKLLGIPANDARPFRLPRPGPARDDPILIVYFWKDLWKS